ncbi:aliphatic sulfonate ABC transporter substrate-binding protein [Leucobacter sp. W1478]|uniref:aliphatic sulfonate ABC transporter substrate-binding protein n=1 Tax=Leucobacter sp. W1478 TaxID=3439065 RepID=UPI003F3C624E
MTRRRPTTLAAAAGFIAVAAFALTGCASNGATDTGTADGSEAAAFRMGTQPWLGYGQWYVAGDQGFFTDRGVEVEISSFAADAEVNAALAAGRLDMANVGSQAALQFIEEGLDVSIVMLLDSATTADAILAGEGIDSTDDLAGKRVAFEEGATSEILLAEALAGAGLDFSDITVVPTGADTVAPMLLAGQVDAGVTYEPYVSEALAAGDAIQIIESAEDHPGLISDVLVVRNEVLQQRPNEVREVLAAWDDAVSFSADNVEEGRTIIATGVGSKPDELKTAFDGVHYYSLEENRALLAGSYLEETLPALAEVAVRIGLISGSVDAASTIDASFLGE